MIAWIGNVAADWFWWIAICGFVVAIVAESAFPDREFRFPGWRWADHIALYGVCLIAAALLDPRNLVLSVMPGQQDMLFPLIEKQTGEVGVLIVGLLLLDLFVYFLHWLQHRFLPLWRFHAVHHSDDQMDASTAMRHHPIAYLMVAICVGVLFAVLGLPAWVFPVFGVALFAAALFQHVNLRLPHGFERVLGFILVTPEMHRMHHSANPAHQSRNFGNVLSVWDRIFGTLYLPADQEERELVLGLSDGPMHPTPLWTWIMPFMRFRPASAGTDQAPA